MSIIPFNSAMRYLLLFSLLTLSACTDTVKGGGGVIVVTETNTPPVTNTPPPYTGPFGGPILNDEVVPLPSPYLPPYTFYELQELIDRAQPGDTIALDRDVNALFGISISKAIKITSSPNRMVTIFGKNITTSLFNTLADNVEFNNIKFELQNVGGFYSGNVVTGERKGLVLDKVIVELSGISVFKVDLNEVTVKNSTILGLSSAINETRPLASFSGEDLLLSANTIVDTKNSAGIGVLLTTVKNSEVSNNVIKCHCQKLGMPMRGFSVDDTVISGNILHDSNSGRLGNNGYYEDEDFDGSFAIGLELSHNITDSSIANRYNADRFLIDDRLSPVDGHSSNITLTTGPLIPAFGNAQLFNFTESKDWTPICNVSNNPSISLSYKVGWLSYVMSNSQTLYYSGAVKPGCL